MNHSSTFALVALFAIAAPALSQQHPKVVLVTIDQQTQRELGRFGGAYRAHHPTLIKHLNQAGARGIGFSVYFPTNPAQAENTRQIAAAAAKSVARGVPVVIAVGSEPNAQGEFELVPNDPVFQGKGIGEGAILTRRELTAIRFNRQFTIPTRDGERNKTGSEILFDFGQMGRELRSVEGVSGGLAIVREVGGYRPLAVELALRAGVLTDGEHLERLDLVESMPVGFSRDDELVLLPVLRPGFAQTPPASVTTVSYVDVIRKRTDRNLIKGALVIVGMHDGELDVHENPDPSGSPALERVSGVFSHVALLNRIAAAAAKEQAPQQAEAKAPTEGLVVIEQEK